MKKRLPLKIECSIWTLMVWLVLLMLDGSRWVFFCYGLMAVHECAHVLAAFVLGCHVEKIMIFPFGFCAVIEHDESLSFSKRIMLYGAGALVHVFVMIGLLLIQDMMSIVRREYMFQINLNYLLFNLLPVYPLDGYHLMLSIFYVFFPYRFSQFFSMVISWLFLFVFFISSSGTFVDGLCAVLLGMLQIYRATCLKQKMNVFYLHRLVQPCQGTVKIHHLDDLYVYRCNVSQQMSEKMLIKKILKL